jgi:hypothetical protein
MQEADGMVCRTEIRASMGRSIIMINLPIAWEVHHDDGSIEALTFSAVYQIICVLHAVGA